jgi:hypothetical protein
MGQPKLNESVEALRAEIRRLEVSHPEDKERLAALVAELDQAARESSARGTLAGKVREAVLHFEVEHPKVTAILNDVLVSLGNVGI